MNKLIFLVLITVFCINTNSAQLDDDYPIEISVNFENTDLLNFVLKSKLNKVIFTPYYALPWNSNFALVLKLIPYSITEKGIKYHTVLEPLVEIQDPTALGKIYFFKPQSTINGKVRLKDYSLSVNDLLEENNVIICWKYEFASIEREIKFYSYNGYIDVKKKLFQDTKNTSENLLNKGFSKKCSEVMSVWLTETK